MLNAMVWCLTFLTCTRLNGQSIDMAFAHANDAERARAQRTACWIGAGK